MKLSKLPTLLVLTSLPACGPFDPGDWLTTGDDEQGSTSDNGVTSGVSATGPQDGSTSEVDSTGPEGSSGSMDGAGSSTGALESTDSTSLGDSSTGPVLDGTDGECVLDLGPPFSCMCAGIPAHPTDCGCFLSNGACMCPGFAGAFPFGFCTDDVCIVDDVTGDCWCDSKQTPLVADPLACWCGDEPVPMPYCE